MGNRRELPADVPPSAPLWVVTFGDMVSLLVTFFVLLFTFSSTDKEKLDPIAGALDGGRGVMTEPKQSSRAGLKKQDVALTSEFFRNGTPNRPNRQEEEQDDALAKKLQSSDFNVPVDLEQLSGGQRLLLEGDLLFVAGSTRLGPMAVQTVREIALLYRGEPVSFVIEAHVDSETPAYSGYASASAMSLDMALHVAEILLKETEWSASRIGTAAYGATAPLLANDTAAGRQKNRRIEILVLRAGKGS